MSAADSRSFHVGDKIHFYFGRSPLPVCGADLPRPESAHGSTEYGSLIVDNHIIGPCPACDKEMIRMHAAGEDVPDVERFSLARICAGLPSGGFPAPKHLSLEELHAIIERARK